MTQGHDLNPLLLWGTNSRDGIADRYGGRVHVVWPEKEHFGLCGLPVEVIWEQRPPTPDALCPLCCVRAMAVFFPVSVYAALPVLSQDAAPGYDHPSPLGGWPE